MEDGANCLYMNTKSSELFPSLSLIYLHSTSKMYVINQSIVFGKSEVVASLFLYCLMN